MTAASAYDQIAGQYDDVHRSPRHLAEDRVVMRLLRRHTRNLAGRVLDLGCGTGWLLDHAPGLALGCRYVGMDVSAKMVEQAEQKHPDPWGMFSRMDMKDLLREVGRRRIDTAVSTFGAFNYCTDPARVAAALMMALRPAGRFFFMVYGPDHPAHQPEGDYVLHRLGVPRPTVNYWDAPALARVFSGFDNVAVRGLVSSQVKRLADTCRFTCSAEMLLRVDAMNGGNDAFAWQWLYCTGERPC